MWQSLTAYYVVHSTLTLAPQFTVRSSHVKSDQARSQKETELSRCRRTMCICMCVPHRLSGTNALPRTVLTCGVRACALLPLGVICTISAARHPPPHDTMIRNRWRMAAWMTIELMAADGGGSDEMRVAFDHNSRGAGHEKRRIVEAQTAMWRRQPWRGR